MVAHAPDGLDGHQRQQSRAQEGLDAREEKEQAHDGALRGLGRCTGCKFWTCYTCKYFTNAKQHILKDSPPHKQVSSKIHISNGLVNGFLCAKSDLLLA